MNPVLEKVGINLVTGVMGSLLPKLAKLLKEEYKLKKSVKEGVESLQKEMKIMHAALHKVAEVPRDQLDEQVKLWAGEVRELSFDMEDIVDKFLVRVDDGSEPTVNSNKLKRLTDKMAGLFTKGKARHEITDAIKEINKQVQEVADRRGRYTVDSIVVARPAAMTTVDPRLRALYTEVTELVGIDGKRDQELIKLLSDGDSVTKQKLKIVSVLGFGGLGKTTLVKIVYEKIKRDFDCRAFVPVGQNADAKKILMDILLDLGMYEIQFAMLDERQLLNKLRESLEDKRYLIVIDDIWDEKLWTVINWAFSKRNNFGSRLITTTRIASVSKLCCSSSNDFIYQMEPLTEDDSKRLFYKRIFSHESGCPCEFEEVSEDILKKCGGVPLAIITIASMLASDHRVKHMDEWKVLLESIGHGLTEDPSVEEMLRILSFSYYDLPSHLKTCLLYLSLFPEDYEIRKDRLICMWIAESFVQCENTKTSLFEIGETYYNELVNRSMIQPIYSNDEGREVEACRVHDMVLDLICSLSIEENFVTISNGTGNGMSSQSNIRRLSLQNSIKEEEKIKHLEYVDMFQVRSVALFEPAIGLMPSFLSFIVLRVLDLTGCDLSDCSHLKLPELGSLFHLRYLGLSETKISQVPKEIGKLQFLQVLDLGGNKDIDLPTTVIKLRRLMCLLIDSDHKTLPDGLGNLTSMEVLSVIRCDSLSIANELGSMVRLRKLGIMFDDPGLELEEPFVKSLCKLSNIQTIHFFANHMPQMDILGEHWVTPPSLQEFLTGGYIRFSKLPTWISRNPLHLWQLSKLEITVEEVLQEYLKILGRLPALQSLIFWGSNQRGVLLVGADGFRCLTSFRFSSWSPGQIVFQPGAMPKVAHVELEITLGLIEGEVSGNRGDCFDLGMENLSSIVNVRVTFYHSGVTIGEAKQAEAALENALRSHPNSPTFHISFMPPGPPKTTFLVSPVPLFPEN